MPPRKICRSSDWLWVELKRLERAEQDKKTEFRFQCQICGDKKIRKNVARNVTSLDVINARFGKMPATPEGWTAMTPPAAAVDPENQEEMDWDEPHREELPREETHTKDPNLEESDSMERTTTTDQQFSISDLSHEEAVLYDFMRGKGHTLPENLSETLNEFIRGLQGDQLPAEVLRAALFLTCKAGSHHLVTTLLGRGVSPNARSKNGFPCLMVASWNNSESVVRLLIETGADVVATDRSGRTSWDHIHDSSNHESIASMLWQEGLEYYNAKIMTAAITGDANDIQWAIEHGADPSCVERNRFRWSPPSEFLGFTPLHHAAFYGHLEAARVLIKAGASINERCSLGRTPLDMAHGSWLIRASLRRGLPASDMEELLIANGAKRTWWTLIDTTDQRNIDDRDLDDQDLDDHDRREVTNQTFQRTLDKLGNREAADISTSPMSWRYTALGAPEVLKESQYKLSRTLGLSTHSISKSIDGSSYRSSPSTQASHSQKERLAKNNQSSPKSWKSLPMHPPLW